MGQRDCFESVPQRLPAPGNERASFGHPSPTAGKPAHDRSAACHREVHSRGTGHAAEALSGGLYKQGTRGASRLHGHSHSGAPATVAAAAPDGHEGQTSSHSVLHDAKQLTYPFQPPEDLPAQPSTKSTEHDDRTWSPDDVRSVPDPRLPTAPPVEMAAQHAENKARSRPKAAHLGRALLMAPCVRVFRSVRDVAKADRCGKANRDYYRYS